MAWNLFDWLNGDNGGKSLDDKDSAAAVSEGEIDALAIPIPEDIALYEAPEDCIEIQVGRERVTQMLDALIPVAGDVGVAIEEYGHAVVKFPEGVGWADLLERKTPGWEGWHQLGSLKNGDFQPQAAIKQVGLSPAAVGNLALHMAAYAVGQEYMAQINDKLEGIEDGIKELQAMIEAEHKANLQACFAELQYIASRSKEFESPEKRQAALNKIEDIRQEAMAAWIYQLEAMQRATATIAKEKGKKEKDILEFSNKFYSEEEKLLNAFRMIVATKQVSMQLDADYSSKRIEDEKSDLLALMEKYSEVRGEAEQVLSKKISKMKGKTLPVPPRADDGYEKQNPLADFAHDVAVDVPRYLWLPGRIQEGRQQIKSKRNRLQDKISSSNLIALEGESDLEGLDELEHVFNNSWTLVIGDDAFKLVPNDLSNDDEEQAI